MDQVRDASAELFDLPRQRRAVPAWRRFLLAAAGSLLLHLGVIALALFALGHMAKREPLRVLSVELAPQSQVAENTLSGDPAAEAPPARIASPLPASPRRPLPSRSDESSPASAKATPERSDVVEAAASSQPLATLAVTDAATSPTSEAVESHVPAIEAHVLDWLARYRSYPRAARRAGIEGVVMVSAVMGRDGSLVERRIATSSGHPVLDRAALDLLARASPVPPLPDLPRDVELHLPIVYQLNR